MDISPKKGVPFVGDFLMNPNSHLCKITQGPEKTTEKTELLFKREYCTRTSSSDLPTSKAKFLSHKWVQNEHKINSWNCNTLTR